MQRWLALAPLGFACACLPQDTRPPPAKVTVTTSASEFTLSGIPAASTADGYEISIDRLLVNLGQAELGGGDQATACNDYSNPDYTRLFDFTKLEAPQELGLAFASGHCPFGFAVRFPDPDAKLGVGVQEADRTLMRTPGSDRIAKDDGISVYIAGTGSRADATKHFAWSLRRRIRYGECGVPKDDGTLTTGIELATNGQGHVNIEIQAEALFRGRNLDALAHFEPYALADADGDGEITLEELWTVPLATVEAAGLIEPPAPARDSTNGGPDPAGRCTNDDGDEVAVKTLGDFLYCTLLKDIARYESNGDCVTIIGRPPRD